MRTDEKRLPDLWHFARPELANAYLRAFDLKLSAARGLFALRGMGKTEFLRRDLMPAAVEHGYLTAYTNLWGNRTSPETALVSAHFALQAWLLPEAHITLRQQVEARVPATRPA
ncbi:hypothetical protein [Cupriavidus sp. DF5525]|uniref:hypothetical protein n=1 Tax=Cupriavidus sp. DF5525 TaxID=3160989 RepID=UPI0003B00783|nr:hypothetical protein N234_37680 [Ralstonia pickettii DTP0602]